MASTIKMVAVVDGNEVLVGRCHPGQARILRKQGLAEWKDGKVVFLKPPPGLESGGLGDLELVEDEHGKPISLRGGPPGALVTLPLPEHWGVRRTPSGGWFLQRPVDTFDVHHLAMEALEDERQELLPDGTLGPHAEEPVVRLCESLGEYLREMYERREAGHTLLLGDDPMRRSFGFVDHEDNLVLELSLTRIQEQAADDTIWGLFEWSPRECREMFMTSDGRERMLGHGMAPLPPLSEEELSRIWESAPECDLNPFIGVPRHNPETGQVEIRVRGVDPTRVANVAGRAAVGRSPERRGPCPLPGWSRFTWPGDVQIVGVLDGNGDIWPSTNVRLVDGYYRRVGSHLLRIFDTWRECWWDVSELHNGSARYHLVNRHKINPEEGNWWDVGLNSVTGYLSVLSPPEGESSSS